MRVAIITESFLPQVNGVTSSVTRCWTTSPGGVTPRWSSPGVGAADLRGRPHVVRVRAVGLPFYKSFTIGLPTRQIEAVLSAFAPDVVHLASPIALGAHGAVVAERLGIPAVAVYQTDIATFAQRYRLGAAGDRVGLAAQIHGRSRAHAVRRRHPRCGTCAATASPTCTCGGAASTARRSTPRTGPRSCAAAWRRAARCWSATWGGWARRSAWSCSPRWPTCPAPAWSWSATGRPRAAGARDARRGVPGFQHGPDLSATFASIDVFVTRP